MCEVVSLSDYKKKIEEKKRVEEAAELGALQNLVDQAMKSLGEIEPEPYFDSDFVSGLFSEGMQLLGPSESALFNSYYALLDEGREDLAELVLEILEMK